MLGAGVLPPSDLEHEASLHLVRAATLRLRNPTSVRDLILKWANWYLEKQRNVPQVHSIEVAGIPSLVFPVNMVPSTQEALDKCWASLASLLLHN